MRGGHLNHEAKWYLNHYYTFQGKLKFTEGLDIWFSGDLQGFGLQADQLPQRWLPTREEEKLSLTKSLASHEDSSVVDSLPP